MNEPTTTKEYVALGVVWRTNKEKIQNNWSWKLTENIITL